MPNSCTPRVEALARHKEQYHIDDVTKLSDFRGLIHVDNEHALEKRWPGKGHELSGKFRETITESAKGGWPPPPRPATPTLGAKRRGTTIRAGDSVALRKGSVPVTKHRMTVVPMRSDDDEVLSRHAKTQFLRTTAPPAPEQVDTLVKEDMMRLRDPSMSQRCNMFSARTEHSSVSLDSQKAVGETVAPPRRAYVYPVLVPAEGGSRNVKRQQTLSAPPTKGGRGPAPRSARGSSTGRPGGNAAAGAKPQPSPREEDPNAEASAQPTSRSLGLFGGSKVNMKSVVSDLDDFEASLRPATQLGNFWMTPRTERQPSTPGNDGTNLAETGESDLKSS